MDWQLPDIGKTITNQILLGSLSAYDKSYSALWILLVVDDH